MSEERSGLQSAVGSASGTGGAALLFGRGPLAIGDRPALPASASALMMRIDGAIGMAIRTASVALLAAEIVLMLASVVARYAFGRPLVWSDELSALMFLWLAVLGAVLALRGGEHMSMTSFLNKASPAAQRFLGAFSVALILGFVVMMILPALDYVDDEQMVLLSTLDISMAWRAAAMPAGFALMALSLLMRLRHWPDALTMLAWGTVLALCLAVLVFTPGLHALGRGNLAVFFLLGVGGLVFAGVPIAFAFGAATLGYLSTSTHVPMSVLVARVDAGMSHQILLSVPLFVFLGLLMEMTGMAAVMVNCLASLLGHVRGGLSYVLVGAMYLVSGISGAKAADMAAVVPVLFPEMEKRGMRRGELVALLAATGAQTETVPPSLILITIGSVTGVSIAALFTGGLLPGLVVGLILCVVVWAGARRGDVAPASRASAGTIARSFVVAIPALVLPLVIRGAVVEGVATATEVSTIGVAYAVVAGLLVYRRFDWARLAPMMVQTVSLSGAILLIVGAATAMAWAITQSGISRGLAEWLAAVPGGAASFMAASAVIFVVLGSVLEGIPAIVLMGPLLFPLARQLGIHEVHYAMVAILSMGVGLFSPPFGVGYYMACAISGCSPDEGMRYIGRYLLALIAGVAIIAVFPWLSIGFL